MCYPFSPSACCWTASHEPRLPLLRALAHEQRGGAPCLHRHQPRRAHQCLKRRSLLARLRHGEDDRPPRREHAQVLPQCGRGKRLHSRRPVEQDIRRRNPVGRRTQTPCPLQRGAPQRRPAPSPTYRSHTSGSRARAAETGRRGCHLRSRTPRQRARAQECAPRPAAAPLSATPAPRRLSAPVSLSSCHLPRFLHAFAKTPQAVPPYRLQRILFENNTQQEQKTIPSTIHHFPICCRARCIIAASSSGNRLCKRS